MKPIILTNSQFKPADKPVVPETADKVSHGIFLAKMELGLDQCHAQLFELRDVLLVQGATITDTLVEDVKCKWWQIGC